MSSVIELSLAALKDLDLGIIDAAFKSALQDCIKDLEDRPGEQKPRTIQLQLDLFPVSHTGKNCDSVNGEFQVKHSIPVRRSRPYNFGIRLKGVGNKPTLVINNDSLGNIDQQTFDLDK